MFSHFALAEPIYIQPGQCIGVGNQQVCALQTNPAAALPSATPAGAGDQTTTLYTCRYGLHSDAEVPDVKSYALVQVIIKPDGKKIETNLKNYGLHKKAECEKDADARNGAKK